MELAAAQLGSTPARSLGQTWYDWGFRSSWSVTLLFVLVLLAIAYCVYLYGRRSDLPRSKRVTLGSLRAIVLILLLMVLFEPVLATESVQTLRRTLLVLVDRSASMELADRRTREDELAEAALAVGETNYPALDLHRQLARAHVAAAGAMAALREPVDLTAAARRQRETLAVFRSITALDTNTIAMLGTDVQQRTGQIEADQQALLEDIESAMTRSAAAPPDADRLRSGQQAIVDQLSEWLVAIRRLPVERPTRAAATDSPTRMALAKSVLSRERLGLMGELSNRYDVRVFAFGDQVEQVVGDNADDASADQWLEPLQALTADAPVTRLGGALNDAASRYAGLPIAGAIVLTDGASNRGLEPVEAAQRLGERGVPVFPIGIGLPEPPDVRVTQLITQQAFFADETARVAAALESSGYAGRSVELTVSLGDREMQQKVVTLSEDGRQYVEFSFEPDVPAGPNELTVTAEPIDGEASATNNAQTRTVRVIDEKIRVLYVEQKPRWEYRYLRQILLRDRRLDVRFLVTEGDQAMATRTAHHIAALPTSEQQLFEYDLVILGDVPASYFTTPQLDAIRKLVRERGGSLLMVAGRQDAPYSYATTPIADVLPVRLDRIGRQMIPPAVYPVVADEVDRHSFVYVHTDPRMNRAAWSTVQPLWDLPEVGGLKPGAHLLLTLSDTEDKDEKYPLMAWQRYGNGKVLYVGTGDLWRLRFTRGDYYHARFWSQAIQFLTLSRLLGENRQIQISADRQRVRRGEQVTIYANVLNEAFEPIRAEMYHLKVDTGEGPPRSLTLQAVPDQPGLFQAVYAPEQAGRVIIRPEGADSDRGNEAVVLVEDAPLEMVDPRLQAQTLRRMAEASGGRYFDIRTLPELPAALAGEPLTRQMRREHELWDLPIVLIILLVAAGLEWSLRRWWNLL